ncbi:CpaD family pilus assembly protein [Rhodoblastus sp.]|jgi:pilus assembly protein CpaD|uniref:CpaD family pilus assembly protein n=1 Tax=Rhodoblastus sp. TaxID=1962975 RepID=UPI0026174766|nr:CpaD family pilus assembly protein [Rhodoblastus sp.]
MSHFKPFRTGARHQAARRLRLATLLSLAAPLAACSGVDRVVTSSIGQEDYRVRHPIELTQGKANLEVMPEVRAGELDSRTQAQVKEFAEEYHRHGSGEISITLPEGGRSAAEARAALPGLRRALAAGGAHGYVHVSHYPVANPVLASPVRLSYSAIVAEVPTRCGQWPNDLASGSSTVGWNNSEYWNYGCATQQMMAAQVADPRDLVGPAADTPPDPQMRGRAIKDVREGKDPGTSWKTQNTNLSGIGGMTN